MEEARFNPDELSAQALGGGGPHGGGGILDHMPEPYRHFFAQLPYVFLGVVDASGWPIATLLTGMPGFVQALDSVTLRVSAKPASADPASDALAPGREIGILGIDLATRRRIRANGRIRERNAGGIEIEISQCFGNCPQYIQRRTISPFASDSARASTGAEAFTRLDAEARAAIGKADTFFVASRSRPGLGAAFGSDMSHRGGRPGFVRIDSDEEKDTLVVPDFRGNHYFNTLGNLMAEPRASMLFVDFESGDLLQLQGNARIDWSAASEQLAGAERLWRFDILRGWRREAAIPWRWKFVDYSPTTIHTGTWRGMPKF
jgi:uncharacterized protein